MPVQIKGIDVENLRGYEYALLNLDRHVTLVVGANNSGKTSLLRILNWLVNEADEKLVRGERPLSDADIEFLLPARDTKHRARRFTLHVGVRDGRSHKRFKCSNGVARLRANIRLTPEPTLYMALGDPTRGERPQSEPEALELLTMLRDALTLVYIPSFRDAASPRFHGTLLNAFTARLEERALHTKQGGTSSEYRAVRKALAQLKKIAEDLARPLWTEMQEHLPAGIAQDARVELACSAPDLVGWLAGRLRMRISTGPHDSSRVSVGDVGSGLQSLLDIAVQCSDPSARTQMLLVVEEPESFLHPSAQRTVARKLLKEGTIHRTVVTTHSPIVVSEAVYGEVVLCRDQRFFEPSSHAGLVREEINTALLSGHGAEMLFARSVLFVEGEGDRQLFERLRRRVAIHDSSGRVDSLVVVPVGGKQSFAPWIRLVDSYGSSADRPIQWLIAADADASADLVRAMTDARIGIPPALREALGKVTVSLGGSLEEREAAVNRANKIARETSSRIELLGVDLESAILGGATTETLDTICKKVGCPNKERKGLLKWLGSKAVSSTTEDGRKYPWMRGYIGDSIPWLEIGKEVRELLVRWLCGVMTDKEARTLLVKL